MNSEPVLESVSVTDSKTVLGFLFLAPISTIFRGTQKRLKSYFWVPKNGTSGAKNKNPRTVLESPKLIAKLVLNSNIELV